MVKKMAPKDVVHGLLEQEDRRMSEVSSTFVQGLPVPFKLDENHFPYHHQECPILLGKFSRMRNTRFQKPQQLSWAGRG